MLSPKTEKDLDDLFLLLEILNLSDCLIGSNVKSTFAEVRLVSLAVLRLSMVSLRLLFLFFSCLAGLFC